MAGLFLLDEWLLFEEFREFILFLEALLEEVEALERLVMELRLLLDTELRERLPTELFELLLEEEREEEWEEECEELRASTTLSVETMKTVVKVRNAKNNVKYLKAFFLITL
ncbi:hypothetical protein ACFC9N_11060 [Enterococcus casseliflavus]|uniref:hypothetical protein n=1 Tax=Enterococcus casseliflavus TaxID=37734 RepID=UPI0039A47408